MYLVGLYQVSSDYTPCIKFYPTPGVTNFTWDYIGKTLEFSLYAAMRPKLTKFCMKPYLMALYQECPNYSPGVKFGSVTGVTNFTWSYIAKTFVISLYLATRPTLTKFCM